MPTQQNGDKQKAGAEICNPSVSKTLKHETIHFVASLTIAFLIQFLYSNINKNKKLRQNKLIPDKLIPNFIKL